MEDESDKDIDLIRSIAARVGEHFGDYLLCVRTKDGMAWKHSDPTWGVGAAHRYRQMVTDQELINRIAELEDE